jgi:GTP cyclohydrolase N terminal
MSELDDAERRGDITIDGHIALKSLISGVEVNVSKAAVEPVWYMPGVAERFGM